MECPQCEHKVSDADLTIVRDNMMASVAITKRAFAYNTAAALTILDFMTKVQADVTCGEKFPLVKRAASSLGTFVAMLKNVPNSIISDYEYDSNVFSAIKVSFKKLKVNTSLSISLFTT